MNDILVNYFKTKKRFLSVLITFLPPLAVTMFWPNIFLKVLDFVGGIGVVILFGILPCVIIIRNRGSILRRMLILPVLSLFVFVLLFKVQQSLNLSRIKPGVEYWTNFRFYSHRR